MYAIYTWGKKLCMLYLTVGFKFSTVQLCYKCRDWGSGPFFVLTITSGVKAQVRYVYITAFVMDFVAFNQVGFFETGWFPSRFSSIINIVHVWKDPCFFTPTSFSSTNQYIYIYIEFSAVSVDSIFYTRCIWALDFDPAA